MMVMMMMMMLIIQLMTMMILNMPLHAVCLASCSLVKVSRFDPCHLDRVDALAKPPGLA